MKTELKKQEITWQKIQDDLADKSGLAILLNEDASLSNIAKSNNNSICEVLTASDEFAPKCQKFCGKVFENAVEAEKPLKYKCYAGLECVAVPFKNEANQQFVAIAGRAFTKSEDYRKATERAISGDWKKFPPTKFFENILLTSSSQNLENIAKTLSTLSVEEKQSLSKLIQKEEKIIPKQIETVVENKTETDKKISANPKKKKIQEIHPSVITKKAEKKSSGKISEESKTDETTVIQRNFEDTQELAEWRSLFNSLLSLEYTAACRTVLEFLKRHYAISSLAWLENDENKLIKTIALGKLETQEIQISMALDDERFVKLLKTESSIELKERNKTDSGLESQNIRLFPISVGGKIQSALVIGEKANDEKTKHSIARFCQTVASELEILRLREELSKRAWLDVALRKFNESLEMIDSEDFWSRLMQTTAELLQAERGSLLVYDEKEKTLNVKAAIGSKADSIKSSKTKVGERIANDVWKSGKALVVPSINQLSVKPAPPDWLYKTESFISYPIAIGERKIGVLNIADKVDGTPYQEFDLRLLQSIIPQIAMAIDHATLKNKAGEFKQLSVTDSLTGLLNRRYLEERLAEEINRSNRHGYPMSFMMIDVDDFKSYNDTFLHPEGDKALQIVGQCLRETLRGADIAARYGGEEFSILLPQTTLDEAEIIAERIRYNIETTHFPNRQVTVSIGIACISLAVNKVAELIESADKALFAAKLKGKNKVMIFEEQKKEIRLPN